MNSSEGFAKGIRERIELFLSFARPRTCLPGMLAFCLSCKMQGLEIGPNVFLGFAITFLYSAVANLFNGYSDVEEDNENLPARLYLLGLYGRRKLLKSAYVVCLLMLALSVPVGPVFVGMTLICIVIAHQYSLPPFRVKARPLPSLGLFALDVAFPFVMAAAVAKHGPSVLGNWAFMLMAAYLFIWFVAKGLVKNLPDYHGDKSAGLVTSATLSSTRRQAAIVAATGTILVYLGPVFLVASGQFAVKFLLTLVWFPIVCVQAARMILRDDNHSANNMLRFDMVVSTGYLSTWILLVDPSLSSVGIVAGSLVVIFLMDALKLDTRRNKDVV
ncbi:UbiA family prenyltransferase [Nocardia sp. CNY236]|uniref:UbiA family prenyltransferase n=1 Tax=Nocardia sp. CNY236 TaxID=1169152 RepID=UPI00042152A6|nr:UbiA family prenyltransferase [Nocardia sp. CNY236]